MSHETLTYDAGAFGAMPLGPQINHVVGTAATFIPAPSGDRFIVLSADKGGFRMRRGDFSAAGMPETEMPGAAVTNGSGAAYVADGNSIVLPLPREGLTVKGFAAASVPVLTYWTR